MAYHSGEPAGCVGNRGFEILNRHFKETGARERSTKPRVVAVARVESQPDARSDLCRSADCGGVIVTV